jgi:hypothetical protein
MAAVVGALLLALGVGSDRVVPLLGGQMLIGAAVVLLSRITPRGLGSVVRVSRLAWAILQRDEGRQPIAPDGILNARRLDNGALLLRLRYPVGAAALSQRLDWLRGALVVRAGESFESTEESARVLEVVVGSLGA